VLGARECHRVSERNEGSENQTASPRQRQIGFVERQQCVRADRFACGKVHKAVVTVLNEVKRGRGSGAIDAERRDTGGSEV
jgi:hypothetical protein